MKSLQSCYLLAIKKALLQAKSLKEKLDVLRKDSYVKTALEKKNSLFSCFMQKETQESYFLGCLIACGQDHLVTLGFKKPFWEQWLQVFAEVDDFYAQEGGIVGYQYRVSTSQEKPLSRMQEKISTPFVVDISANTAFKQEQEIQGILHLDQLCLLLPVGGAADRLHLVDPKTKEDLPAGCLFFNGETLLEKLFFDVQALEYLHYKLLGKTVQIPIVLMSSHAKNNHLHIQNILRENAFFHRFSKLRFILQPCVPVVDEQGLWCLKNATTLLCKPSGHGALWKKMQDDRIFTWLKKKGCVKALIRQVNNPIPTYDSLLGFLGYGLRNNAKFGMASCPREVGAKEGIKVVKKSFDNKNRVRYLSNIEYCDFLPYGIKDTPQKNSIYGKYPSNTNILFVDLASAKKAVKKNPLPGLLLNFKSLPIYRKKNVSLHKVARLESTMQTISDQITRNKGGKEGELPGSYITYNQRYKTISTAKKALGETGCFLETPERCFYDSLQNIEELLTQCNILHEKLPSFVNFLDTTPGFLLQYHPALGPLFSIIAQKMRKGRWGKTASARLHIAELDWNGVDLNGDVLIYATQITGHIDSQQFFYSENTGKCTLENVSIQNLGRKKVAGKKQWQSWEKQESLSIILEGNAEFVAKNLTLSGDLSYRVSSGTKLVLSEVKGRIVETRERLKKSSWYWKYREKNNRIVLKKSSNL